MFQRYCVCVLFVMAFLCSVFVTNEDLEAAFCRECNVPGPNIVTKGGYFSWLEPRDGFYAKFEGYWDTTVDTWTCGRGGLLSWCSNKTQTKTSSCTGFCYSTGEILTTTRTFSYSGCK